MPAAATSAASLDAVSIATAEAARDPRTHQYPTNHGTEEFRAAAASFYRDRFGVELDPDGEVIPVLGGKGNVGDNVMELPSGTVRGVGLRSFDEASRQWSSWWLDGRTPTDIAAPVRGGFQGDIGTFIGDDTVAGRPVKTRVTWSRITPTSARWEQSSSADGGQTWESNWVSDFVRAG